MFYLDNQSFKQKRTNNSFHFEIDRIISVMATEQVMQWINRDIRLSKVIHSFETDFSNGYLFGEILCQYGVYDDISVFDKKTNKEAKVNNFYLIEDALRMLKVRFDGKMTHSIMQEERGAALRLLYQLKLAIMKREGPPPDHLEAQTMTGLKQSTVNRKFQANMEKTNTMSSSIKPKTFKGKDIRTNNKKMEDAHLIQFEVAMKNNFDTALAQGENERTLIKTIQQRKRAENRDKLRENQEFMQEWEQEGRSNWKQNQKIRAANIARQQYFEDREVNLYKAKLAKELDEATAEMSHGVSEFDKNLQKLGIETNINIDDAIKRQEEKQGIPPGQIQNFSFPATMNKIKETKKQSDFAGKERERRRRKLAVDQANTQQRLDKQKQEDNLVQKLLQQQQEEQNNAYANKRLIKCKQMVTDKRRSKALQIQAKRETRYKEMEEQSRAETLHREAARKVQIKEQVGEYEKIRRETKRQKRSLNIEIASGVIDLIMDMADEVFDVTREQPGNKMTKAQWREFSGLFVDGKKCTLRNIKRKVAGADQIQSEEEDGALHISSHQSAVDLTLNFRKEPALHDLYQFMSNSGCFNLDQLKGDLVVHWGEQLKIEKFLLPGEGKLVKNEELGKMLEDLYANQERAQKTGMRMDMSIKDQQMTEEIKEAADEDNEDGFVGVIPSELPLKLAILGRPFSGKKTIASMLVEKYGGDKNIRIFNMDDVIKEALDYITPKKVDEAALEAQKKAKKGKVEEVVNLDIFEGKHPSTYKKIANEMKSKFFSDYEGDNLPQQVDLPNVVFDDQMMVNLFVERLKLEYEGQDLSVSQADLEAGIAREQELVDQLAEMEDGQAAAEPAKKGGKPAKGGKGNDLETLKEELESIRSITPKGWILVDFPRSLAQMKLLETCLSGYESKADLPKDESQAKFEAWAKVATPSCLVAEGATGAFNAIQSGFDGVVILETPEGECTRRSTGRKIDPQTNTIYHMETDKIDDAKVLDRLQDYNDEAGDTERMQKISSSFAQSIGSIKQWLTRFGLTNEDGSQCQVQLDMDIVVKAEEPAEAAEASVEGEEQKEPAKVQDPWLNKSLVFQEVEQRVSKIAEYRQRQFQQKRKEVKLALQEKARLEAEAEAKKQEEEERKAQLEKEAAAAAAEAEKNAASARSLEENAAEEEDAAKKGLSIDVPANDDAVKDEALKTLSSNKSVHSKPQSIGGTSRSVSRISKLHQRVQEINDKQKVARWDEMLTQYYSEGMKEFNAMRCLRQRVCRSLNETQQKFINYLGRQSDQQRKVNDYCDNYNRFSMEFPDLIGNPETLKELKNRINILSQLLWDNIRERKDEAMKERLSYMEGGWVQIEMIKLCSSISSLIGSEFKRFSTISAIVTGHVINEEVDLQDVAKRLTERGVEPYIENQEDRSQVGESPILLEVAQTILTKVEALFNEQFVVNLDQKILRVLNTERQNFSMRLNLLFTWATLILHEISCQAFEVFDILDDWVVIAVKQENQSCQNAVKELSRRVEDNQMHLDTVILQHTDLQNHIETIDFYDGPPSYMVQSKPNYALQCARPSLDSLKLIYRQLRAQQEDTKLIDAQTFLSLTLINIQQEVLPNVWRYVPFGSIQELAERMTAQPLTDSPDGAQVKLFRRGSTDNINQDRKFLDWRRAFVMLALIAGQIPTNDQKQAYFGKLRAKQTICDGEILTKQAFIKIDAWFDKCESAEIQEKQSSAVAPMGISPSQASPRGIFSAKSLTTVSPVGSERQIVAQLNESIDEEDDDGGDQERLEAVKGLLFDTYRVQNHQGIDLKEYVADLEFVFREVQKSEDDDRTLYQTLLNMPQ